MKTRMTYGSTVKPWILCLVLSCFVTTMLFAGSFQETVKTAIETGRVSPAPVATGVKPLPPLPPVASPTKPLPPRPPVASTTKPLPPLATGTKPVPPLPPVASPTKPLPPAPVVPTNPDKLTSNPEVDPKGEFAPAKVANLSAEALRKLILKMFNVKLVGGLLGQGKQPGDLWTQRQMWEVYRTLYSLPKFFASRTLEIVREGVAFGNPNIAGYVWSGIPRIYMCDRSVQPELFNQVLVHEMAHCWEFTINNRLLQAMWQATFWSSATKWKTQPPTAYGCTNFHEDFAESVKLFWANGPALKARDPARYAFIKNNVLNGREFAR